MNSSKMCSFKNTSAANVVNLKNIIHSTVTKRKESLLKYHPAMEILRKALQRELRLQLVLAWALVFGGLALIYFGLESSVWLVFFGLILVVLATGMVLSLVKYWHIERHPMLQSLQQRPKEIVWVYALVTERMPFGIQFIKNGILYFKLKNGEELSVSLSANKLKLVSKTLSRLLPHATFGYSIEREQTFITDPEQLLRRKNEEGE